ncbi:GGDEF domain-containing protein [Desulfitobacterium hafniense]|uniref:GGDEF domain-containing protein n=1 Tax=Desulfitobacterium hafniense (strain Y51) TaxID=138119 RepID=Q24ZC8_DESHY|nr:GGDEF domain-containing protein [Desulfitobacterium hafniense]BAE82614.1 hypothetical protein DSY0825 [Desulfitobacterium hafniense Y51]
MIKVRLFGGMVSIGILYAWIFHKISMSIFNSLVIQSLVLGLGFGVLNFLFANWYVNKYAKLENHNEELKSKLVIDKLTGIYNRRALDLELHSLDSTMTHSIIFIDIDNFRVFNNEYGHKIGDIVLQKVCEVVCKTIRSGDRAYRYGGEEIVVLLKDCNKVNAQKIAEKIRTQVNQLEHKPYPQITISLGVASCPTDGESIQNVIERADSALLLAKSYGKNCTVTFN